MSSFYTSVERFKNEILVRGYKNGKQFQNKVRFKPEFYINSNDSSEFKSLVGDVSLQPIEMESMSEAREFVEKYKDVRGFSIYGTTNYVSQFIQHAWPNEIKFNADQINIVSFDIEVDISTGFSSIEAADKEITSISYKSSKSSTYHLLTNGPYDKTKTISGIHPDDIQHMKFDTEEMLLRRFVQIWMNDFPDVVTGWNVKFFDIAYTVKRIENILGQAWVEQLSPWGKVRLTTEQMFNKDQVTYEISGVSVIDYMDAFKKFGYKYGTQESYKLDHIAYVVLGEKKLDYSEYGSLTELYNQNPQLYFDYNLKDTVLVQKMEEETGLLSLVMTVAYGGGVNYNDAFGTVGIWESIIYRRLMASNIVPPIKSGPGAALEELVGGYVKDPVVGMHDWVVSFDLNSLYPHLMLQYNMSPETIVRGDREMVNAQMVLNGSYQNHESSYSVCANGVKFRNDVVGVIPSIITEYYANRKVIKTQMLETEQALENATDPTEKAKLKKIANNLHNQQMAIKIAMNSLYGATANRYFAYYISDMAEGITTSGQLSIMFAQKSVNEFMNKTLNTQNLDYILYIDTDSIYVNMKPYVQKFFGDKEVTRQMGEEFLDKLCAAKIEPVIKAGYEKLASQMGAFKNAMSMKREKITDKTIFLAKKRYIMNVLNSEGVHYDKPKIAVTGIESVRSSTPETCREVMKKSFDLIINNDEATVQKFIADFKKKFISLPPEEVAKISGTDDLEKYMVRGGGYAKGTPMHVRGCIVYNQMLKEKGLTNRYEVVQSGDKVKFIYLKMPNPLRENIVSFTGSLPKELDLHPYIDYETQFEKVFLAPIETILTSIGWESEKRTTLMDFFA